MTEESIKGKIISRIIVEEEIIIFTFEGTDVSMVLTANGDCCSHSRFECDDLFVELLLGNVIDIIELRGDIDASDDGEIKTYKPHITLTNGDKVEFKMINTSNGYYGGWIEVYYKEEIKQQVESEQEE